MGERKRKVESSISRHPLRAALVSRGDNCDNDVKSLREAKIRALCKFLDKFNPSIFR